MFNKKGLWRGLSYVFSFALIFSILAASLLESFRTVIDGALGTVSEVVTSEDDGTRYSTFVPDDEYLVKDASGKISGGNSKALLKGSIQLGRKQGYEGAVLLKNENHALPLAKGSSVTLLGKRTHMPILGSKMGVQAVGQIITLETALGGKTTDFAHEAVSGDYSALDNFAFDSLNLEGRNDGAGAGFRLNPAMIDRYAYLIENGYSAGYNDGVVNGSSWNGGTVTPFDPNEPSADEISNVSLAGYQDAAIIVISRPNQESGDYMPGVVAEGVDAEEPLQLTSQEKGIIDYAGEHFEKVIVLLNTNCAVEIKDLKEKKEVDAILWIGHPGNYGCLGIADILCGRVNPSGGLADIYATNNLSAPAMMNMGTYVFANADEITRVGQNDSTHYLIEAEGIYVGYRYYETRYYDTLFGKGNASSAVGAYASKGNWNYSEEVTYGFGYGLSYTDFEYKLLKTDLEQSGHELYMTFTVEVKNVGETAGATPVQIYGQAPYIHGVTKVEKSAIQLLEFGKTGIIEPGKTEVVEIEADLQNLASYDSTNQNADGSEGTYILDEGDYYFAVGNGAHDALNCILAKQGKTPGNTNGLMDYAGNEDLVFHWKYDYAGAGSVDANTFAVSKNNVSVHNQIPYADWNDYGGASRVVYLSRSDWAGTYPKEYVSMVVPASMLDDINGKYYQVKTGEDTSDILWGESGDLKFYQLSMSDFNDSRWEKLLNQLTLDESIVLAAYGGPKLPGASSIGLIERASAENTGNGIQTYVPQTSLDQDAPWYIGADDNNGKMSLKVFGSAPLVASSFSHDVMYETGAYIGTEALFVGVPILWGPGANTHRHAYNGRNGEYYSEDPVLTGVCTMEFAIGALEKGLIVATKHFAFNDQDTNRQGIAPFMTEQRAREIELRAFQIAIEANKYDRLYGENVGMLGMMTSFSKIGAVECTCSRGLLNGIAVGEWGFRGYTVTDGVDDTDLFSAIVIGGCTGYDKRGTNDMKLETINKDFSDYGNQITAERYAGDATFQKALKESNKRLLFALCHSNLMNAYNATTHTESCLTWWRAAYIAAIVVTAIGSVGSAALYVVSVVKNKKDGDIV